MRYSEQAIPLPEDLEDYFFYAALQATESGLAEHLDDYHGYNSFHDAINGRKRVFRHVDWATFNERKRFNRNLKGKDFTTEHTLEFKRLPGYEHLTQRGYKKLMLRFEECNIECLKEIEKQLLTFHDISLHRAFRDKRE